MFDHLSVGAICTRIVSVVEPSTPLAEAARLMRKDHIGCVVVIDRSDPECRLVGILTDRDIIVMALALDLDARLLLVEDIMTREVASISEDAALSAAIMTMRERGVRRMPVVSRDGVLVGLLAFDDVIAAMAIQLNAMTEVIVTGRVREGEAHS
jgi:CBS domain-containing protein